MNKLWSDRAWDDYLYWQTQDKKTMKRINELVKSIERDGLSQGIGKPEPLKHRKAWSRRIDETNRLIYNIDENGSLWIIACRGHYEDQHLVGAFSLLSGVNTCLAVIQFDESLTKMNLKNIIKISENEKTCNGN